MRHDFEHLLQVPKQVQQIKIVLSQKMMMNPFIRLNWSVLIQILPRGLQHKFSRTWSREWPLPCYWCPPGAAPWVWGWGRRTLDEGEAPRRRNLFFSSLLIPSLTWGSLKGGGAGVSLPLPPWPWRRRSGSSSAERGTTACQKWHQGLLLHPTAQLHLTPL